MNKVHIVNDAQNRNLDLKMIKQNIYQYIVFILCFTLLTTAGYIDYLNDIILFYIFIVEILIINIGLSYLVSLLFKDSEFNDSEV